MISTGNTNDDASGGIWQNSRINPAIATKCGLSVAMVLDLSNSVTDAQLVQLKAAAAGMVDALTGTPSSVGTFTFATSAPAPAGDTLALTPVSTPAGATTVKNKINGYNKPGGNAGGTNWDRGIYQVAQSPTTFDVAVVITDGNPTFYGAGEGPGSRTRFREVENGIFSANAVKAENTKVIAFGVGDGVANAASGLNLRAISGTVLEPGLLPDHRLRGRRRRAEGPRAGQLQRLDDRRQAGRALDGPGRVDHRRPARRRLDLHRRRLHRDHRDRTDLAGHRGRHRRGRTSRWSSPAVSPPGR